MKKILLISLSMFFSPLYSFGSPVSCIENVCKNQECYQKDLDLQSKDLTEDNKKIQEISNYNTNLYYSKVADHDAFIDVTSVILGDQNIRPELKKIIKLNQRKIMVFSYLSDGVRVPGFINYVPGSSSDLVIILRGGNTKFGIINPAIFSAFKNETIVGTIYQGVTEGKDDFGGLEVHDVKNLINFIPFIEEHLKQTFTKHKKYIIGMSRGGMQMFRAITEFPELQVYFDKAISISGMLDLELSAKERLSMLDMFKQKYGLTERNAESWYRNRSTKYQLDKINKNFPILILQGTNDSRVSLRHGAEVYNILKAKDHNIEYWEVKDADHCLSNCKDFIKLIKQGM